MRDKLAQMFEVRNPYGYRRSWTLSGIYKTAADHPSGMKVHLFHDLENHGQPVCDHIWIRDDQFKVFKQAEAENEVIFKCRIRPYRKLQTSELDFALTGVEVIMIRQRRIYRDRPDLAFIRDLF